MVVKVYYSSVTGNLEMKKQQQRIFMILDGKTDDYEKVDIAASEEKKKKMRDLIGNPGALPPQIFNEDVYCGDFKAFEEAVENETLNEFLKL